MPKDLNQIASSAPKDKQMARVGIAPERLLHEQGQTIEALAHVRVTRREPHAHTTRNRDHRRARTATTRASAAPFTSLSTITRQPAASTISITPRATAPEGELTASGPAGRLSEPDILGLVGGALVTTAGTNAGSSTSAARRPWLSNRRPGTNWPGVQP